MNYGRYEIIKEVGRGAMGVVYQARDPHIDRLVAVKVLRQDRLENEAIVRRFMKEAKVIGRLSHPNIVTIYDVGDEQGNIYIAMEFLEGISLADVRQERRLETKEVAEFGVQIAETLDYAHRKGVVHRDIKPSNIIVQSDGVIKITDFGIARVEDSTATLQTQTGEILGTPAYMSPEQVLGQPVDGRSDIFSLGVILYELATGKRPFGGGGKTLATVFNDIIQITPPEPSVAAALIPPDLSQIIMKALQKEPGKRFQTGNELAAALVKCLGGEAPVPAPESPVRVKNHHHGAIFAVVALLASISGGIYFYNLNKGISPQRPQLRHENISPATNRNLPPSEPEAKKNAPVTESREVLTQIAQPETKASEAKKPDLKSLARKQEFSTQSARIDQPRSKHYQETVANKKMPRTVESKLAINTSLKVSTTPQGARVYIDGNLKGTTPLTIILPVGKHQARIIRSGYQELEREITVDEMMEYPIAFNLKATD